MRGPGVDFRHFRCYLGRMFGLRAFRTWTHVVAGATVFGILFMLIVVMAEYVIGNGVRITPAARRLSMAAFVGYFAAAWLVRRVEANAS